MTSQDIVPKDVMDGLRKRLEKVLQLSQNIYSFSEIDKALAQRRPSDYWRHDAPEVIGCLEELSIMYVKASLSRGYLAAPLASAIKQEISNVIERYTPRPLANTHAKDLLAEIEAWTKTLCDISETACKSFVGPNGPRRQHDLEARFDVLEQAARSVAGPRRE
ncbi:MAG: hypothetical protein ACOYJ2_07240 [Rickettsiales bacterium]